MDEKQIRALPKNAYRKLKKGEEYVPVVPAHEQMLEVTPRSVLMGLVMAMLFSGAAAFLGLKVGQVFEAAIPIAILAVGYGLLCKRKSTILENVMIQSIGAASGAVVAGAIFTLPALYILGLDKMTNFFQIFSASLLGAILGILILIPLRRYFVKEEHGNLPFPEATATTEVLVAGEKGGKQAWVLAYAMVIGGIYDFLIQSCGLWQETVNTKFLPLMDTVAAKAKFVFSINIGAAILGLGYIIGVRYATMILAGSLLSWWVFVPLMAWLGNYVNVVIPPHTDGMLLGAMNEEDIFGEYVRYLGIGGIFAAGIVGIIRGLKTMVSSFSVGIREIFASRRKGSAVIESVRTDRDLKMSTVLAGLALTLVLMWAFFRFGVLHEQANPWSLSVIALFVAFVISFLFTTVAARAIAIVGVNPVSGMTLMTLLLASLILIAAGLKGPYGMVAGLLIGGVVCTALSMAGCFITDLKIGYWLGSTPRNQQRWKFLGGLVSAAAVAGVIIVLNQTYGFVEDTACLEAGLANCKEPLVAPQANAMAAVIETFMSGSEVPWVLYGVGAVIALIVEMLGISGLAFALGMYIPLEYNSPIMAGALLAWAVKRAAKSEAAAKAYHKRGTLLASGLIAGGAILGVGGALIKFTGLNLNTGLAEQGWTIYVSIFFFLALLGYLYWDARRVTQEEIAEEEEDEPEAEGATS